jgi:hypothetical protein
MNARRIPGTAVESSLRLVRVPLDVAIGWLPGNGTGPRPTARLALDRADAAVRAFAGTILGDPVLSEDAQMRRAALREREHGQALRHEAEKKTEQADARLQERHDQVARQRAQSELRAKNRRDEADRERTEKTRRAAELEGKRVAASNHAARRADDAVSARAPKARLETLDAKTDALRKKEQALAATDEARRLREAASRTKAERKAR